MRRYIDKMKNRLPLFLVLAVLVSCRTAEEEFIGDRLLKICNDSYILCNFPTGCVLNGDHYVKGSFPGVRRVVVESDDRDAEFSVRLFLKNMKGSGTEMLVQLYEPDCTVNTENGRVHLEDVDIFDKAGDDRTLMFELGVEGEGEHVLEIYSDASTAYLLIAELK